jgi:SIR2-like domain
LSSTFRFDNGGAEFLIAAAEGISSRLSKRSPGVFRGWLQDTVGTLEPKHPEILHTIASLGDVLATLNYDGLFERATERTPVTWLRPDKVEQVLLGKITDAVLHLHGYFDEPESVILDFASYAKVASDAHASTVLRTFLIDRIMLFVGCGGTVKDPNFSRLVEWAKEGVKDVPSRHVLLCREEELETVSADLTDAPWLQVAAGGSKRRAWVELYFL